MFKERCVQLTYLEEMLDRDVFLMCHNRQNQDAMIDGTMIQVLRQAIRFSKRHLKAALIIQTPGGYASEGQYIGKFFREYYEAIDTYIVSDCYSAGTLIALSSDNIYMSRNACLGPIDLQHYYDAKRPWSYGSYSLMNALNKAITRGDVSPKLLKVMRDDPEVVATYFKTKYNFKKIFGKHVRKHCRDKDNWERVWDYMAELNLEHGSALTYKRCVALGLDVKRMPRKIDEIISRIVTDADEEFGGLYSKSLLCDFYESSDGNFIKKEQIAVNNGDVYIEMGVSKKTEKLAIIETSQTGYIEECDMAITFYGLMPMSVSPIKSGWREEYNTSLALPEQNEMFEDYIKTCVIDAFEESGVPVGTEITKSSYDRVYNLIKKNCYDSVLEILKEEGNDVYGMSSAQKWKAVVEYCLEMQKKLQAEEDEWLAEKMKELTASEAKEQGIDYNSLTDEEKEKFFASVLESKIPEVAKELEVSEAEIRKLDKYEQYELILDYILSSKN